MVATGSVPFHGDWLFWSSNVTVCAHGAMSALIRR